MDYVLIPEGFLKDRIERLAQKIYRDYSELSGEVQLVVIMNSALRFSQDLIVALNKQAESGKGKTGLKITIDYIKITTQHLDKQVVQQE